MTMIYTGSSISFQHAGKFQQVNKSNPSFKRIVELVKAGDYETAASLINVREVVASALSGTLAELKGNSVFYKGVEVRSTLSKRIIDLAKEGFDAKPLLVFLENLMENPSKRAVDELYGFLEASGLPITEDGHFLAYKSVRQDYKDYHSGTMDNSPGSIVEMERNKVDEDKDRTCSKGLHFAAHEYAKGFHSGGRMVVLKINPRDVVAIPSDYNNQKGRCCRYEVVEEVERSNTKLVDKAFVAMEPKEPKEPTYPVGTEVYIRKDSKYYVDRKANPKNTKGVVTEVCGFSLFTHTVKWDNGWVNKYRESDLTTEIPLHDVGTEVYLRPDSSNWELKNKHFNPQYTRGIIRGTRETDGYITHDYEVTWDTGKANCYLHKDLTTEKPEKPKEPKTPNKFPVGTEVYIRKDSEYYGSNAANPKNTKGEITGTWGEFYYVKWVNGSINSYRESDLTTEKPYEPQVGNHDDPNIWERGSASSVFEGKHPEEFPVDRNIPYRLLRSTDMKRYHGEFFFKNYDEKNGNLVFARMAHDGSVDRWVTIKDINEWFIRFDWKTFGN